MPIRLDQRKALTKTTAAEIDGEQIKLEYRPACITFDFDRRLRLLTKVSKPEPAAEADAAPEPETAAPTEIEGVACEIAPETEAKPVAEPEAAPEPETERDFVGMILEVVAGWDLEESAGVPVALTVDALLIVPTDILLAVLQAVRTADSPVKKTPPRTGSF